MPANRVCPKCNYQRKPTDDKSVSENECPNCGIIYGKFTKIQSQAKSETLDNNESKQTNVQRPRTGIKKPILIYGGVGILIAIILFVIFIQPENSPPATDMAKAFDIKIPGEYIGEFVKDGRVSTIAFEIDEAYRIRQLAVTDNRFKNYQKEVEWRFPDYLNAVTYRWKMDGRGNQIAVNLEKRLLREGQSLTIENIRDGESQGAYVFLSDKLVEDAPSVALLRLTADKKSLYVQFNLQVPAIGPAPRPENYFNRVFRATALDFSNHCSPGIFFLGDGNNNLSDPSLMAHVAHFAGGAVGWKENTVCRFKYPSLMLCAILFTPSGFKGMDPSLNNSRYRKHYEFEAHADMKFDFWEPYIDPAAIWIGKDGYGHARIEGTSLPFAIRKADLKKSDQMPPKPDWNAMIVHYQLKK